MLWRNQIMAKEVVCWKSSHASAGVLVLSSLWDSQRLIILYIVHHIRRWSGPAACRPWVWAMGGLWFVLKLVHDKFETVFPTLCGWSVILSWLCFLDQGTSSNAILEDRQSEQCRSRPMMPTLKREERLWPLRTESQDTHVGSIGEAMPCGLFHPTPHLTWFVGFILCSLSLPAK